MTTNPGLDVYPGLDLFPEAPEGDDSTTDEWWDVDGVSLQTLMWNISSWGGPKQGTIPLRGEDDVVPHMPGRKWRPKVPDANTIELTGWVVGADVDGTPGDRDLFRKNWRALRALFWGPRRQIALTRRWKDDEGVVKSATGYGQVIEPLIPEMTGATRAEFTAAVHMADPFFYGEWVEVPLPVGSTDIVIEGDAEALDVLVTFTGVGTDMRVTAGNEGRNDWLQYASLDAGEVVLDVRRMVATEHVGLTQTRRLSKVTWKKGFWLPLEPGPNVLTYSRATGTATCTVRYRPVWM